jgi:hypothetical protein
VASVLFGLCGHDVAGVAQTGYAKTNAFGLSYAARMLPVVNEVDVASWLTVVLGERGMNQDATEHRKSEGTMRALVNARCEHRGRLPFGEASPS